MDIRWMKDYFHDTIQIYTDEKESVCFLHLTFQQ
jgi:hypothetical protein